jgi:hypothetical protein
VYYSQGYRIDIQNFSITKTGALHIQSTPRDVQIFLNDKPYKDKSSLLRRGTFVSNILPKEYRALITKEGYRDYEKYITVKPAEVVRLLNIILVPEDITHTPLIEGVPQGTIVSLNQDTALIKDPQDVYYECSLTQLTTCTNLSSLLRTLLKENPKQLISYQQEAGVYIATTSRGVYRVHTQKNEVTPIFSYTPEALAYQNNNLYTLAPLPQDSTSTSTPRTPQSSITVYDLSLSTIAQQYPLSLSVDQIETILPGTNAIAILLTNGSLLLRYPDGTLTPIAHSAQSAAFSPDQKKLLFQDRDKKTFVYFLEDDILSLNKQKGDTMPLEIVNIAQTSTLEWYDSYHLLITYQNGDVALAEVDAHRPNNHFTLLEQSSGTYFSPTSKTLYTITQDNILTQHQLTLLP